MLQAERIDILRDLDRLRYDLVGAKLLRDTWLLAKSTGFLAQRAPFDAGKDLLARYLMRLLHQLLLGQGPVLRGGVSLQRAAIIAVLVAVFLPNPLHSCTSARVIRVGQGGLHIAHVRASFLLLPARHATGALPPPTLELGASTQLLLFIAGKTRNFLNELVLLLLTAGQ